MHASLSHAKVEPMGKVIDDFIFNDFCLKCQKVTEHRVSREEDGFFGFCTSCAGKRRMTDVNQVYYPKTDLWVTRFKIGNLPSIVTGKLIDATKHEDKTTR